MEKMVGLVAVPVESLVVRLELELQTKVMTEDLHLMAVSHRGMAAVVEPDK
jgi:hypothetical protein